MLLLLALLLPWNLEFGLGVPGSNGLFFVVLIFVTLLAVAAALAPHVGPFRLAAPQPDVRRTSLIRLLLTVAYLVLALGFVGYHLLQTVRNGGTGLVPPGVGPGLIVGVGGALLAAQPPITSITIEDNGFRRWYTAARVLGAVSIALATLSVAFNLYWRLRYLFVTNGDFGGHDVAVLERHHAQHVVGGDRAHRDQRLAEQLERLAGQAGRGSGGRHQHHRSADPHALFARSSSAPRPFPRAHSKWA